VISVLSLDLNRHAVLEASAGTGKTHALIELVVRLLTETSTRLDQVLLVTFTEKATGELKARLRARLQKLAAEEPRHEAQARAALDAFEQAAVHTIHGFCQRVLQDHAFENRQDFAAVLVDDGELADAALREVQRGAWPRDYGTDLASILQLARFPEKKWDERVCRLAVAFRPGSGNRLVPDPGEDPRARLVRLDDEFRAVRTELRRLARLDGRAAVEDQPWWLGYDKLSFREAWRNRWRDGGLRPVLAWLAGADAHDRPWATFAQLVDQCQECSELFKDDGFSFLVTRARNSGEPDFEEIEACCPGLREALAHLDEHRVRLPGLGLEHHLAARTVEQIQCQLAEWKRDRGLQSFDDMLVGVDSALDPARNPAAELLVDSLRRRFHVAVVDEFQDTDPLQWAIFRRIFVDRADAQRLFVVGDPKQAIYAFRGADLGAYRRAVEELKDTYEAEDSSLDVNWRSEPRLLDGLNQLFGTGGWFAGTDIDFKEVKPAPQDQRPARLAEPDRSGRPPINLLKFDAPESWTLPRRQMARFVAREIAGLLRGESGPLLRYQDRHGTVRDLEPADVCILIARRREAHLLEEELRTLHLPYTFYKQSGLWESSEAVHLGHLLRAIARPQDRQALLRALLTRFFRLRPEELARSDELPAAHPARVLFERWREWAGARRWAALFHSIRHDTGILLAERDLHDADRRRANLLHLTQSLEQLAYVQDLDLFSLVEVLQRNARRAAEEESLQPVETDRSKVRLMTIHAAKGLEFPVVFLAGGFTGGMRPDFLRYHDEDNRLVLDLRTADPEASARHEREVKDEERRLYYVALTRAMFKLYVPWVVPGDRAQHQAGPVVTLLAPAIAEAGLEALGPETVAVLDPGAPLIAAPPATVAAGAPGASTEDVQPAPPVLFPALPGDLSQRRVRIRSFSSLHRHAAMDGTVYQRRPARDEVEVAAGPVEADPFRGPVFGDMLHDVLEAIDFAGVGAARGPDDLPPACRTLIEQMRRRHWARLPPRMIAGPERAERCAHELARLIWNTLHAPLPEIGPLCEVPRSDRLHELEFHFPAAPGRAGSRGAQREEGFLTGFIDLVVRRGERFYLVDWKSNALPEYAAVDVARSMAECDYVRQYRIYLQALAPWLKRHVAGFDRARHLAGVFYLYVRGLSPDHPERGVYHHRPTREDFDLDVVLTHDS
jgi:exodeoxyribonuclease V beta subunit